MTQTSKKKSNRIVTFVRVVLVILILCMIGYIGYTVILPQYQILQAENELEQVAITWLEEVRVEVPVTPTEPDVNATEPGETVPDVTEPDDSNVGIGIRYDDLWNDVQAYNEKMYKQGQTGLRDVFDYEVPSFDLSDYGVADDVFGAISIPKINVILPLYLGATYRHMADGFAQMSHTSIPIGGENTNAVVACHRGWNRMAYLRDVEMIEIGDSVYVHNLWEDLEYRVVDIYVIEPDDLSILTIQEGRDLITLFTCHPYGVSTHRYVVLCERYYPEETEEFVAGEDTGKPDLMTGDDVRDIMSESDANYITQVIQSVTITTARTSSGNVESSSQVLFWTVYFPWILLFVLLFLIIIAVIWHTARYVIKKTNKKKKKSLPIRML